MKHIAKALVLASALAAAGAAQAQQANATLVAGGDPVGAFDYEMSNLRGGGQLDFSELLLGALSIANIGVTAISPGTLIESEDGTQMSVTAPITQLSGTFDLPTASFTAKKVTTAGGATMVAAKKNVATNGGSLSISDIKVDLTTKGIYATLTGGNGVGTKTNQLIWNYANIEGPVTFAAVDGTTTANNKITGLTITQDTFDLFATSLGLTAFGKSSMAAIDDYGIMNAQIMVDVKTPGVTPTVPEPSTYVLMGVGLVGLAFASKRARRA